MPTLERFQPRELGNKVWGIELLVAQLPFATGKVMFMKAGFGGPLQYHERKHEAFYLFSGEAHVELDNGNGLEKRLMQAGETYQIPPGAVHRVSAISDCVMFEVSNPVFEDRVNVEHLY